MSIIVIPSRVPRCTAIALILASAFAIAGRAQAQTSTTPPTGQNQPSTWALPAPAELQDPLANYRQNFAGFQQPVTVPLHYIEAEIGVNYAFRQQSMDDIRHTLNDWTPRLQVMAGLPYNLEFDASIPFVYNTLTVKDSTGQDSHTTSGIGNMLAGLKYNFVGDNGGPYALSFALDGQFPTASYDPGDFFRFSTSDHKKTDMPDHRDRTRSDDVYGVGGSLQGIVNLPYGFQVGIDSGASAEEPWCECCLDNRFSIVKSICSEVSLQATLATSLSTSKRSDWEGVVYAAVNYQPTPAFGMSIGPTYNITEGGSNIGFGFQMSYAAKAW